MENKTIYIATCPPYTYSQITCEIDDYQKKLKSHPNIYFLRETITHSLEGRDIELLTISSYKGIEERDQSKKPRICSEALHFKNKKIMLLTARIHPGEVQGSYMLKGILTKILNE